MDSSVLGIGTVREGCGVGDCVADVILVLIGLVLGQGVPECKDSQALNLTVVLHMLV